LFGTTKRRCAAPCHEPKSPPAHSRGNSGRLLAFFLSLNVSLYAHAADWLYLTVPGDTLIGIGNQYLKNPGDWPKVQSANNVAIPRHLPVNTRLKIPVKLLKVTPASVAVTAVGGNVRVKGADNRYQRLQANDQLNGGETVLTGPRSSASYRFADGTALTQQASSKLSFGRLAAYGKTGMVSTELNLESGRLEARASRQLAPAGGFRVRTPVAVAGLRGTGFRLNVAEDGQRMSNEVTEGEVSVSAQGKAVNVAAGFGTYAEAGKPPAPPRALLAPPDLSGLTAKYLHLPLQISWPAQPGAVAWRVQIGTDASFATVLLDDVVNSPSINWGDELPDGDYALRLRAVDDAGLEGLDSTHPFTLDARPLPPLPLAPALGERLYQPQANFSWTAVADARGYLLQVAPTPEFKNGLIERRLPPVVQHQETLDEGEWHWRLASLDENGQVHLFSPHRAFRIQPLPVPPAGGQSQASSGDGKVHFTWGAVRGADSYGLEVSKDSAVVVSKEAKDTAVAAPLEPGKYNWRVRGLEADGQAGNWSGSNVVILPPLPPHDLKVDAKTKPISLAWQGEASRYRVEIASDPAFAKISSSQEIEKPEAILKNLEPGDHVARVIALGADGIASLPSQPVAFTVERAKPWWLLLFPLLAL
jgi:hypothetical protein